MTWLLQWLKTDFQDEQVITRQADVERFFPQRTCMVWVQGQAFYQSTLRQYQCFFITRRVVVFLLNISTGRYTFNMLHTQETSLIPCNQATNQRTTGPAQSIDSVYWISVLSSGLRSPVELLIRISVANVLSWFSQNLPAGLKVPTRDTVTHHHKEALCIILCKSKTTNPLGQ